MIAYVLSNALVSVVDADTQKNARQQATGYPCLEYMEQQMEQTDQPGAACMWQLLLTWLGAVAEQQHDALQGKSPASVSAALLPAAGSSRSNSSAQQQQQQQILVPPHHVRFLEVMGETPWRIEAPVILGDWPLTYVLAALVTVHMHVPIQSYLQSPHCNVTASDHSSCSSSSADLQQQQQQLPWEVAEWDSRAGLLLLLLLELQLLAPTSLMLIACCRLMSEVVEAAHEKLHDQLQQQQQQQQLIVESGGLGMTAVTVLTHVLSYLGPLMLQPPAFGPGPLLSPGEKFTPEAVSELHGGWAALVTWLLVAGEKCR
jgi:hypothetical protein